MKIIRDYESPVYTTKNRLLGQCFTVIENKIKYHFEFDIRGFEAYIKYDRITLVDTVIEEFRKYFGYINIFYNEDRTYYRAFDDTYTFKLPIKIIQPSKFFINKERLDAVSKYLEDKEVYIPVAIIDDEYVAISGHTKIYAKVLEDAKMVNVYMADYIPDNLDDLVYMAKENNILKISQMEILTDEEYKSYIEQLAEIN
ncbi:MAG: hypothetical protein K6F81_01375 [Acholeplasmatales bacterium]|nr:hypothetical protein [Acholeplasmatales bacterium]